MATATADKGKSGGNTLNQVLFYVFLIGFVLVSLFPLLWVFKMSIVTKAELFASPPTILPQNPTDSS
ncbi:MAG: carbohydrate ABC transporter permease, partial [Rubrobacteraceae bacterium]